MRFAMSILFAGLAALAALAGGARAAEEAAGRTVLVVEGAIGPGGAGAPARFDMAALRALPRAEFATSTLWTEGVRRFSGVRLADLLEAVEARGARLQVAALNDYVATVPVSDAAPDGPIVAYAMDGEPMSIRDKGPLWLVYPYDHDSAWRSEQIYARSVWQLHRIRVVGD
jgi:hypothetical protein